MSLPSNSSTVTLRAFATDAGNDGPFAVIHAAFLEAFSDYVVKLSPTAAQLREMLERRGWVPELSVGAYDGETLVAFTLNGFDGVTGYDSGTGVLPTHRRRGLAEEMMEWSRNRLGEAGATRYLLEVIETNAAAVALYQRCGFDVTRRLQCWSFESSERITLPERDVMPEWWDIEPAWQNSTPSIRRARERPVIAGDEHGYVVVFPSNGDVPQLAVEHTYRRRGNGRRLLNAAATLAGKPLRIMNVDARDEGIAAFLEACGAKKSVAQFEMALQIPRAL
jgi:ribosomal protein S18 acetylase RimI-like enzyme